MGHRSGLYDGALATAREGCCQTWPKPCTYHEGYGDGYEQAVQDSAAPDMEKALETAAYVLEHYLDYTQNDMAVMAEDARAALAKAKGQTPNA